MPATSDDGLLRMPGIDNQLSTLRASWHRTPRYTWQTCHARSLENWLVNRWILQQCERRFQRYSIIFTAAFRVRKRRPLQYWHFFLRYMFGSKEKGTKKSAEKCSSLRFLWYFSLGTVAFIGSTRKKNIKWFQSLKRESDRNNVGLPNSRENHKIK